MKQFYKTKNNTTVVVIDKKEAYYFNEHWVLANNTDIDFVVKNMAELSSKEVKTAEATFDKIKDFNIIENTEWIDFFINKKTYKIYAILQGSKVELDTAESKLELIKEKEKLEDFLKWIRKAKENYAFWDRVLLYGPTWTWKTYNFIEFLKVSKVPYSIVPVTEWMEDIDFFNRIVPWAKGVSYMPKEICELLEKAEKWEKVCIIFDELNRWSNSLMNLVLKALDPVDWKNYYITDVIQDKTYIIPQDNIIWWATVNLWGKYTWTNALDEALLDRFNIIKYKWYNKEVETAIIKSAISDSSNAKKVYDLVKEIREYHKSWEIRAPISTRWIKVWLEDYINTWNLMESFEKTILYRLVTVDDYWNP